MFHLVGVMIIFKHYHVQVKNFDQSIAMVNNWPNDMCLHYMANANFKNYIKIKVILFEEYYELTKKVKYFEEISVDDD